MTSRRASQSSLGHGLGLGALTFGLVGLLSLGSTILTARLYGIDVVGEFALAYAPTGIVVILSSVREQPALARALTAIPAGDERVTGLFLAVFAFSETLTVSFAVVGGIVTVILFHGGLDRPDLVAPALITLTAYAVINNLNWNLDTIFAAYRASRALLWIRLHQAGSYIAAIVLLSLMSSSVWAIVGATLISWMTTLVHRMTIARLLMPLRCSRATWRYGVGELPTIVRFGLRLAPSFLALGISNESGTWILGYTSSTASIGAFNRSWGIAQRLVELNFRITEILFPTLVSRSVSAERASFDRALVDSLRYAVVALAIPPAVLGGCASTVMKLFGEEFTPYGVGFAVTLLVPAFMTATSIQAHAMFALDRTFATAVLAFARLVLTGCVGVALSARFGFAGMALALAVGAGAQMLGQFELTRRMLEGRLRRLWPLRQVIGLLAAYGTGFGVAHGLDAAFGGTLIGLPLVIAFGTLTYLGVFMLVGKPLARDVERLQSLANHLPVPWTRS